MVWIVWRRRGWHQYSTGMNAPTEKGWMTKPIFKLVGDRTAHFTDSFVRDMDERNMNRMTSLPPVGTAARDLHVRAKRGARSTVPEQVPRRCDRGHTQAGAVRPDG